jgi:sulfur carrier protein ThiS
MALNGLSVMDALVATHIKRLYPRPGLALTLKVNSQFITIEGDAGKHATVLLDGKNANLGDPVQKGSRIEFEPPLDGRDASITVRELISKMGMDLFTDITVNDEATKQMISVLVNGKIVSPEENVPDRAEVIIEPATLKEVLQRTGNDATDKVQVTINRKPKLLDRIQLSIRLNGNAVEPVDFPNTTIKSGDKLQIRKNEAFWTVADIFEMPASRKSTSVILNGEKVTFNGHDDSIIVNGRKAELSERVFDGDDITIKEGAAENPILSDLFEFMDINREELVGKNIKLFVNGTPARFTTPLREGNKVSIEFQEV